MAEAKHAPGPWSFSWESEKREWAIVTAQGGSIVANVNTESGPDAQSAPAMRIMPADANARLISAAPDLLEALKDARQTILDLKNSCGSECEGSDDEWVGEIDAAIAKAEGRHD